MLEAAMHRRFTALPTRFRPFVRHRDTLPRAFMLTGPRGVGKTTYLLYHIQNLMNTMGKRILYLSADNPTFAGDSLYEIVSTIFLSGYSGVVVDEVHFARDWSIHLKALYDDFPQHSFWISDSSSLRLRKGIGDISRRFVHIKMPVLSFREFLFLEEGIETGVYNPFQPSGDLPIQPTAAVLSAFRTYQRVGTRPFYREGDFSSRMFTVLDKTLYHDIPFFLPSITENNLRLMKAITATLAKASIPRLEVRSLCSDWGIGAEKLYQLLEVMEEVELLRIIRKERDHKARTVGEKLFFSDPAFYMVLGGNIGNVREAMVSMVLANAGYDVEASRDETKGDFVISRVEDTQHKPIRIEVGGRSKDSKGADFVISDSLDYPSGNRIPLWLLGMIY